MTVIDNSLWFSTVLLYLQGQEKVTMKLFCFCFLWGSIFLENTIETCSSQSVSPKLMYELNKNCSSRNMIWIGRWIKKKSYFQDFGILTKLEYSKTFVLHYLRSGSIVHCFKAQTRSLIIFKICHQNPRGPPMNSLSSNFHEIWNPRHLFDESTSHFLLSSL